MTSPVQIAIAFGSVGALVGVMALVRRFATRLSLAPEVQRKLIHVVTGLYALGLPWIFPDKWPVYMLVAMTLVVMLALRIPGLADGLGQTLHGVERHSYGDFSFALAIGLCLFLAQDNVLLYVVPIAVVAFGDAAGALAGSAYGHLKFRIEGGQKSIEGTAAVFVVTLLVAIVCFLLLTDLPLANLLALSFMVAAFGALVEAQSWRGFDNLFLPLGLLIFLRVHGESDLPELYSIAVIFSFAILGFIVIGPRLGLSAHASSVYVVAVFLIIAMTEPKNAVLPALVLVVHAWSAARNPSDDAYGELDIVAALAFISFGWLALGRAMDWNAIAFYGLTAMGLVMGLAVLALNGSLHWVVLTALTLFVLRTVAFEYGGPASTWTQPLWTLSAFCILVPAAATLAYPASFTRDRVLKLTLLALILPLGYYLYAIAMQPDTPT